MKKNIFSSLIFFLACLIANAQQPKYTPKHFVTILDTNEFKITMPKEQGEGHTFVKTRPPLFDVDDDNTTAITFDQEVVVMIEGTILNGKKNGIFTTYLIDSFDHKKLYKIWEQSYKNDSLNGVWKTYNLKGNLVHIENNVNNKLIGIARDYWIDGKIIMGETEYFADTAKRIERKYYNNGNLKSDIRFIHDLANGTGKKYYENGVLKDQVIFKDGKLNGIRTYYYPNGKEWIIEEYKNDKDWTLIANFDSKGNKRNGGTLKNGTGTLIFYDDDTTVREVRTFKNGEIQK